MHDYAKKAAIAALAAGNQGKFWEIHEKLFASQDGLNDAKVEAIAQELGLDMVKFNKDREDPSITSLVDRDISNGNQVNVGGTPTIFVSGKLLNQRSLQGFDQAIGAELRKRK